MSFFSESGDSGTLSTDPLISPEPPPFPPPPTDAPKPLPYRPADTPWWSELTASWIYPLISFGVHTPLEVEHLTTLPDDEAVAGHVSLFESRTGKSISGILEEADSDRIPLASLLVTGFWVKFVIQAIPELFSILLRVALPVLLQRLLAAITEPNPDRSTLLRGLAWTAAVFVARVAITILTKASDLRSHHIARGLKSVLRSLVFGKAMVLSSRAQRAYTAGEIINITSTDTGKLRSLAWGLNNLWSSILLISGYIAVLWWMFGVAVLAGLAALLAVIPLNLFIFKHNERLWDANSKHNDERVRIITDLLNGIRILKLFAWEALFRTKVDSIRSSQLTILRRIKLNDAVIECIWVTMPVVMALLTIMAYSMQGHTLSTASIFAGISVFHSMTHPLFNFPWCVMRIIEARVSLRRLQSFLSMPNLDRNGARPGSDAPTGSISLSSATFAWGHISKPKEELEDEDDLVSCSSVLPSCPSSLPSCCSRPASSTSAGYARLSTQAPGSDGDDDDDTAINLDAVPSEPELTDISLNIAPGSLVGVVGVVGSGKSSLLHSLLGEMQHLEGDASISGSIGYVAQTAWIQNDTVRGNILFNSPPDLDRYAAVVKACALEPDLALFDDGDLTEIGEKGVNLSGGQRQRVSLARATYADCDIYLLDDPLSAVDPFCATQLFDDCISGLLANKTRVLVTHYHHLLPRVDHVVYMDNGRIIEQGSYQDLMATPDSALSQLIARHAQSTGPEAPISEPSGGLSARSASSGRPSVLVHAAASPHLAPTPSPLARVSPTAESVSPLASWEEAGAHGPAFPHSSASVSHYSEFEGEEPEVPGPTEAAKEETPPSHTLETDPEAFAAAVAGKKTILIEEEDRMTGSISMAAYSRYLGAAGWPLIVITFGLCGLSMSLSVGSDYWLGRWSEDPTGSMAFYLRVYAALSFGQGCLYFLANVGFAQHTVVAARKFHDAALNAMLRSALGFFEKTPSGRIVNRFGHDVSTVDGGLNWRFRELAVMVPLVVLVLLLVLVVAPVAFFISLLALFPLYLISKIQRSSIRELARLTAVSYSPINAHISETLAGTSTIRAFGGVSKAEEVNAARINTNMQCNYVSKYAEVWCDVRMEVTGCIVLVTTAVLGLSVFKSHPTLTALALINADRLVGVLGWAMECFSWLESDMASAERLLAFANLEAEPGSELEPPAGASQEAWLTHGAIEYRDVEMRYRPELPLALRGVSFSLVPGEKVGIVGRSGSGKTSLISVLFRLNSIESGSIHVSGVDIGQLPLSSLRSALSIIPQESILFAGTLRENFDPEAKYSDQAIWDAINAAGLTELIQSLPEGLETELKENASGFSVGQLQLLCLARALLKRARVLVMDEATASTDADTDAKIQATIKTKLTHATVLSIAHRLHSVIEFDKVLVMDAGRVAEFDSPAALLDNPSSIFSSMVDETGSDSSAYLRALANEHRATNEHRASGASE